MQPNLIAVSVAANIRAELARQRKTQRQLRVALGIGQTAMARRISGEVPFSVADVATAAEFLGIPLDVLIDARAPAA